MKLVNQDTLKFSQRIYAVSHHSLLLYIVVRGGGRHWRGGRHWHGVWGRHGGGGGLALGRGILCIIVNYIVLNF